MATLRHKKPENWLGAVAKQGHGIKEERVLGRHEQASEALLMGLRLAEGLDLASLAERFGFVATELADPNKLELYESLGMVWREGTRVGVTPDGMPLLDALLGELVPAALVEA